MNWKAAPKDASKLWLNRSLELQILLACSWSCTACNAYSNFHGISFTKKGMMSVAQIKNFIAEMHEHNAYFGRIRVLGGEPGQHPRLHEIIHLLYDELVLKGHVGHLELITNGDHMDKIKPIAHLFVKVRVSGEGSKQKHHVSSLRTTPALLGYEGKRCGQPEFCGWSLSAYGYAPCSAGAGLMRLRDLMATHQRIDLPLVKGTEANWPQLQELCNHCLHGLRDEDKVKCGTGTKPGQAELNAPHPEVWDKLVPWLHGKQPDWPIYGQAKQEPVATA